MNENEFKNVINSGNSYHKNSFKRTIAVPFLSGVLGCSLVIRNLLWCSKYKRKIDWS